jgi:sulfite reductase (ferredoxin)
MESFRTEIENPIVQKGDYRIRKKIHLFRGGKIDDERFRSLRLARGIYGQRQEGVQMIRIKLPYGKVTSEQLRRITKFLMNTLQDVCTLQHVRIFRFTM